MDMIAGRNEQKMMNVSKEGKMRLHNGIIVVFLLSFLLAGFHLSLIHI